MIIHHSILPLALSLTGALAVSGAQPVAEAIQASPIHRDALSAFGRAFDPEFWHQQTQRDLREFQAQFEPIQLSTATLKELAVEIGAPTLAKQVESTWNATEYLLRGLRTWNSGMTAAILTQLEMGRRPGQPPLSILLGEMAQGPLDQKALLGVLPVVRDYRSRLKRIAQEQAEVPFGGFSQAATARLDSAFEALSSYLITLSQTGLILSLPEPLRRR